MALHLTFPPLSFQAVKTEATKKPRVVKVEKAAPVEVKAPKPHVAPVEPEPVVEVSSTS